MTMLPQTSEFLKKLYQLINTFAKALRSFETCVSVNNNLCGKLVLSLEFPMKFNERFKFALVPFLSSECNQAILH